MKHTNDSVIFAPTKKASGEQGYNIWILGSDPYPHCAGFVEEDILEQELQSYRDRGYEAFIGPKEWGVR